MWYSTNKTLKTDITILLTQKVKSHSKKLQKKKKQFHNYKVMYFMQKFQRKFPNPPKTLQAPNNLPENIAMLTY